MNVVDLRRRGFSQSGERSPSLRERTAAAASPSFDARKYKGPLPRARCRPLLHPNRRARTTMQQRDHESGWRSGTVRRSTSRRHVHHTSMRSDGFPRPAPNENAASTGTNTGSLHRECAQPRYAMSAGVNMYLHRECQEKRPFDYSIPKALFACSTRARARSVRRELGKEKKQDQRRPAERTQNLE